MDISGWISAGSFIAACLALWLNFKTRRDYKLNLEPVATIKQTGPGEITVSLRSVSNIGYRIKRITVVWPPTGKIANRRDMTPISENRFHYVFKRSLAMDLPVTHSGSRGDAAEEKLSFSPHSRLIFKSVVLAWEATRWLTRSRSPMMCARFLVQLETEREATKFRWRTATITFKAPDHG